MRQTSQGLAEEVPMAKSRKIEERIDLPSHEGLSEHDAQLAAQEDPDFEGAGRIHDWRNHVGEQCRQKWPSFAIDVRLAIASDAQAMAEAEEWE